jgi:hypothetical protein
MSHMIPLTMLQRCPLCRDSDRSCQLVEKGQLASLQHCYKACLVVALCTAALTTYSLHASLYRAMWVSPLLIMRFLGRAQRAPAEHLLSGGV